MKYNISENSFLEEEKLGGIHGDQMYGNNNDCTSVSFPLCISKTSSQALLCFSPNFLHHRVRLQFTVCYYGHTLRRHQLVFCYTIFKGTFS